MASYDRLKNAEVNVHPVLADSIDLLLRKTKRQLTTRNKIRNNRRVVTSINIHKLIFLKYYEAIRDFHTEFGRTIKLEKKNKKKEIKKIIIAFTHKGSLTLHLNQVSTIDVKDYLKKKIGSCDAGIVVTNNKLATLSFDMSKNRLDFTASYKVTNKYGNIC